MSTYIDRKSLEERFWYRVKKTDSCWLWTGAKTGFGYGMLHYYINDNIKHIGAHRASLLLNGINIPKGKIVCHKCDVKLCVNPDHLFIGTNKENTIDMISKGRGVYPGPKHPIRGEEHDKTTLTNLDVSNMRREYAQGTQVYILAKKYKVCWQTADNIVKLKTWRHIG